MLVAIMRLVRLSNSLPASALVLLGAKLTHTELGDPRLWLAMAAMWSITAFGYVSNDLTDLAEDRINQPDRPLPAGAITQRQATLLALSLLVGALWFSSQLGWRALLVAILVVALLLLYNGKLKGTAGLGNLLIASLAACALLPGVVAVHGWQMARFVQLLPVLLALLLFIGTREILKTLEDLVGDGVAGKRTLALQWGVPQTLCLIACLALLFCGIIGWLFCQQDYAISARFLLLFGVGLPLLASIGYLVPNAPPAKVSHTLALLKGCYFVGLVALWIA